MDEMVRREDDRNLIPAKGLEEFLNQHFQTGIKRFSIDSGILAAQKKEAALLHARDEELYHHQTAIAKKDFKRENSFFQRLFGKVEFVQPAFEPSLPAVVYQTLVTVGETLQSQVNNLDKFSGVVRSMASRYNQIKQEEAELLAKVSRHNSSAAERQKEYDTISRFLVQLDAYEQMVPEERSSFETVVHDNYRNLPIEDNAVRVNLRTQLNEIVFILVQETQSAETDAVIDTKRIASLERQIIATRKNAHRIWEIYNPARLAAAELYSTYEELLVAAEQGILIYDVAEVVNTATALCAEAQRVSLELECVIEAKLEITSYCNGLGLKEQKRLLEKE